MPVPFIRDGKLVDTPFAGMKYNLKRLSMDQAHHLSNIMGKQRGGHTLNDRDISELLKMRRAARISGEFTSVEPTPQPNSELQRIERLQQQVAELKRVFD